jgi:DNA-binding winged helix-turn-helix (wHTH) protein
MASNASKVSTNGRKNDEISTKAPIYRVAGLEIEPGQASVRRGSESVALRPKTYRFLLYLVEHPNRVVSKEELIGEVWEGANVSDGVLVRSVVELRKAFADDPKDPQIIKTFPKMGYGLMAPVEEGVGQVSLPAQAPKKPWTRVAIWIASGALLIAAGFLAWWRVQQTPVANLYREIAWWKMDSLAGGKAADSSANHIDGAVTGNARAVLGKLDGAVWFDGLTAAVSGRSDALPSGNVPRTITAWFKAAAPQIDDAPLFDYGSAVRYSTRERLSLYLLGDGRVQFGWISGTGHHADDAWHFVAAEYRGPPTNIGRISVDGRLETERRFDVEPNTLRHGTWRIGNFLLSGAAFRGAIDDVRVYPRALGPAVLNAIYRCSAGIRDLGEYYYLPVFAPDTVMEARGAEDGSTPLWHQGKDVSGIQLARAEDGCGLAYLEGADVGQDLRIAVDLLTPRSADGRPTLAGPYFRSRLAAAGDGIMGGTSAGYWVSLVSTGMVKLRRLNPLAVVAFSDEVPHFDSSAFHHLEMEARSETLEVWLDGESVSFDQGGSRTTRVRIPPTWNGPPVVGTNQGAAGVAFGTLGEDRGLAGGQRARGLRVEQLK